MRRDRKHSLFAWILVTIGVIFVLENFGIVDDAFSKLWPVLLIVIGVVMIVGDRGKRE